MNDSTFFDLILNYFELTLGTHGGVTFFKSFGANKQIQRLTKP